MKTMNVHEAAGFLGVHRTTVMDLAKAGKLPGAKVGRAWVFLAEDLTQYLRSRYKRAADSLGTPWGSTAEKVHRITGTSSASAASAYEKALALPTGKRLKSKRVASATAGEKTDQR